MNEVTEGKASVSAWFPVDLKNKLDARADELKISKAEAIKQAVELWLQHKS